MIKILDQNTIDKIAAGEVIERPSSIVKELVENSIDAGATAITIEIKDGGVAFIRVTDNGSGIEKEDIRKAYLRHATSKLDTAEDLLGVMTLGFRGEALSTIAAVSQTEMITKTRDSLTGVKYVIHGGREIEFKEIGAPDGTTIIVKNVFYNTPARLKFLKTNLTEGSYIHDLVTRMALSRPDISFRLISGGKTLVDTSGNGKAKEVIYALYGRDITRNLLEVHSKTGEIEITGYIGKPFISKGNRSFENYFINGRYIKCNIINRAIEEAYKTYVMQHRFPFTALYFSLPPEQVDVNVHPTKMEFRYHKEQELFTTVHRAIAAALQEKELIPDSTVAGRRNLEERPAPQKVTPRTNPQTEPVRSIPPEPLKQSGQPGAAQNVQLKQSAQPEAAQNAHLKQSEQSESSRGNMQSGQGTTAMQPGQSTGKNQSKRAAGVSGSYSILEQLLPAHVREGFRESMKYHVTPQPEPQAELTEPQKNLATEQPELTEPQKNLSTEQPELTESQKQLKSIESQTESTTQSEPLYQQASFTQEKFLSQKASASRRIIGQVFDTYWLFQYEDELFIMDQHAAHEKVNYERFLKEFKSRTILSQQLFPPEVVSVSSSERLLIQENMSLFLDTGFELEEFGGNEYKLNAMPMNLYGLSGRDIFLEFVAALSEGVTGVTEDIFIRKLATMACKAAIKGNQSVTQTEIQHLLEELMTLENPYTCPHGRPTMIRMSKTELEKKFKRIV